MTNVNGGEAKTDPTKPQIAETGGNKPEGGVSEAYRAARGLLMSFDEFKANTPLFNEEAWVDTMDTGKGRDTPSFLLTGKMIEAGLILDGAKDAFLSHNKGGRGSITADEAHKSIVDCTQEALVIFNEAKAILASTNPTGPTVT